MYLRKPQESPVGLGAMQVPYDQSGGNMSTGGGMSIPEPGGTMKKMQFEFTDPAQAAATQAQGIPQGAGIPPAGAQPAQPQGMQAPSQMQPGSMLGQMAGGPSEMGQGPNSSMLGDDQLMAMLQQGGDMGAGGLGGGGINPIDLQADQMQGQLEQGDPDLQMQMMMAARRMGGF